MHSWCMSMRQIGVARSKNMQPDTCALKGKVYTVKRFNYAVRQDCWEVLDRSRPKAA